MNKIFNVTAIEPISPENWVRLYNLSYTNRLGQEKKWIMASRKKLAEVENNLLGERQFRADAVIISAIHEETGNLILINEYRPIINSRIISLPAGIINKGEDAVEAAKRELFEETGLTIKTIKYVSPPTFSTVGLTDECVVILECICTGNPTNLNQTPDEDIEVMTVNRTQATEILQNTELKLETRAYFALKSYAMV